jgi:hypothetical protein
MNEDMSLFMTGDPNSGEDSVSTDSLSEKALQFETVVPAAGALSPFSAVVCGSCQQHLTSEYYDVNGVSVCDSCRASFAHQLASSLSGVALIRIALYGLGAAIAGAIVYYAVVAITDYEIGLVAIAIGYMVGYAIKRGAAGRGARSLQVLAVVLTYWSVGLAYTSLAVNAASEAAAAATVSGSSSASSDAAPQQDGLDSSTNVIAAIGSLAVLTFMMPAVMVFGSLPGSAISALIIGFGMHQAWQMTGAPKFEVSGPFQIAAPALPAG